METNRPKLEWTWNNITYTDSPLSIIQSKDENNGKALYEFLGMSFVEAEKIHNNYVILCRRFDEYPHFSEYLDGIVKGDQEQINKYIADCLSVKEKYPKP